MRQGVLLPRTSALAIALLVAALPAAAQVARSDVPDFPSDAWFDTGGDGVGNVSPPKFDILNVHTAYVDVNGEETAFFRFTTGETKDRVSSSIGITGYLDTDSLADDPYVYETRFFTVASELYEGAQNGAAQDSVLVIQQWNDATLQWETTSFHTYSSGTDLTGARPEADGGGCPNNDASCAGWLFDTHADLSPSHTAEADRTGTILLAMAMDELGATEPPLLLPTSYVATAPLSNPARDVALNIFSDGNPCNDPATPYYDEASGTCTSNSSFDWKDGVSGETAFATPASIDLVERIPGGVRVHVVSVQGPTFLELWWQPDAGVLEHTGVELAVRDAGVHTVREERDRASGRYVVVDRGVQHLFGAYAEDGERLDGRPWLRSLLRRWQPPAARRHDLTRPLRLGRSSANGEVRFGPSAIHVVDVGAEGAVLRLPAEVDGRSVSGIRVDGERHLAFDCAVEVRCVLVPPSDATRTRPVHRAAVVELGASRPAVEAPRGTRGEAALLVERQRLPTKSDVSQWAYPLEHPWALTWLATPWLPSDSVVFEAPAAELVALELEASSKYTDDDDAHKLRVTLDDVVLHDATFRGPHAQLRIELGTSHAGGPAVLTVETGERADGGRELLALTGAVLEHARAPIVGEGFYALVRRAGTVSLDEDAIVLLRDANGNEKAWRVRARQAFAVDEGQELGVLPLAALGGAPAAVHQVPSPTALARADVVVLVGGTADVSDARAALDPWTSTWSARGRSVLVAPFATVAASLGATADDGIERVVSFLASQPNGPAAVVIVGSATPVPERELPAGAFHVPAPRRWHAGYTFSSDLGPALDVAASGGRLMPVTRVPVVSQAELTAVSARLAAAAGVEASNEVLILADGSDDFSEEGARIAAGVRTAALDPLLVDAGALGRQEASRRAKQATLSGVAALWYIGHGSFQSLGSNLVSPRELRSWASAGAPPLTLIANTCFAGNLAGYGSDRMPDRLFRWDTPVRAALLGAGQLDVSLHRSVSGALTAAAASEHEIGSLWAAAMRSLLDEGVPPEELAAYPLLGDPFAPVR